MNTNESTIRFEYARGKREVYPEHEFVKRCVFDSDEIDEALLMHFVAKVGEKNGMSANDIQHIFPLILRMLKSNIKWSQ